MSNNTLTVTVFAATLLGAVFFLSLNIKILKKKLKRWDVNSTIYFIMSHTNVMSAESKRRRDGKSCTAATMMRARSLCAIRRYV